MGKVEYKDLLTVRRRLLKKLLKIDKSDIRDPEVAGTQEQHYF